MKKIISVLCASAMLLSAPLCAVNAADSGTENGTYIWNDRIYDSSTGRLMGVIDEYLTSADASAQWVYDKNTGKTVAVKCEYVPDDTYTKGDWIYDKKTDKIVDYCGKGGNIVVPDNTTVSKFVRIAGKLEARTGGRVEVNNVTIGENVSMDDVFLSGCTDVKTITFKNSAKQMKKENLKFTGCKKLEKIVLPKDLTEIQDYMFDDCLRLKEIENMEQITSIGRSAFSSCFGLKELTIPQNLSEIGDAAFYNCFYLTSVVIPETVTAKFSNEKNIFSKCTNITSLTFGDNIDFKGLPNYEKIEEINYSGSRDIGELLKHFDNTKWAKRKNESLKDANGFSISGGVLVKYLGTSKTPSIPNTVKIIGEEAFRGSDITSVTIPGSVTEIAKWAFMGSKLKAVTIPSSVKTIGEQAFASCKELESLVIEGPSYVKAQAFADTALTRAAMNINKDFKYEGIETKTRYEYDPLMYYYPDFDESWLPPFGDWFVVPVIKSQGNKDVYIYGLPPTPAPSAAASPNTAAKPGKSSPANSDQKKDQIAFPTYSQSESTSAPESTSTPEVTSAPESFAMSTLNPEKSTQPTPTAEPAQKPTPFDDISADNELLCRAVNYLYEKGIVDGYEAPMGRFFHPESGITRAEMAKMLDIASGSISDDEKSYNDVTNEHWAHDYIRRSKYFEGYEDGSFRPEELIFYGEAAAAIVRFAGLEDKAEESELEFPKNYISTAAANGLMDGVVIQDGVSAARGDIAITLYNAMNK